MIKQALDIDLLRSFLTIVDTGSFTQAGEALLRTQSTVSLQLKRLEKILDRRLLDRTPHDIRLTPEGEMLLAYARRILSLHDEAWERFSGADVAGRVRIGTPEDFATQYLPDVLNMFSQRYPYVDMEVTCDLTLNLLAGFQAQNFDLVLLKREASVAAPPGGVRVWREPLVWAAAHAGVLKEGAPVPLIASPAPCVYRKRAVDALTRAGRGWRTAYTCASLAGIQAAVRASLGVTVLPKDMVPKGFHMIDDGTVLPPLEETEIALLSADNLSPAAQHLKNHIILTLSR